MFSKSLHSLKSCTAHIIITVAMTRNASAHGSIAIRYLKFEISYIPGPHHLETNGLFHGVMQRVNGLCYIEERHCE